MIWFGQVSRGTEKIFQPIDKEFEYFKTKFFTKLSQIGAEDPGSGKTFPACGSRGQKASDSGYFPYITGRNVILLNAERH